MVYNNEKIFDNDDILTYFFSINIVDYFSSTIYDVQNEKDYLDHCNVFENNQDFEIVF